ncbi:hypothetical protein [Rouxiella sp. Mn2063]|uniref:hypothetical protein n=1 Tax=Rouxiella sp. Mn2063 TaxID=3395262 RepID=UPI003BE4A7C4
MKAEMMHAAISKESPVSSGFQLNEDDVQKIEGAVTGGSQGLMKIMPQVENAVKLLKLFTNQMFSGFQTFYRLPTQASDIESVDDGVLLQTTTRPQESSVQTHDSSGHRRGMASLFTNVGQQIGALLEQQPQALAQQLGMDSNTVNEPPRSESNRAVDTINTFSPPILDSTTLPASHGQQSVKKGVMPSLASVMQNDSVKMIADSLDYVKGKYGGGFVDTMRKLVKNPFLKPQQVIAGSNANEDGDPRLPTADLLASYSAGTAEVSPLKDVIAPAKQSIAAIPVAKSTQRLDSLAQKLLVNLQPGVNSLSQLVNQWPIGDSTQTMEHVGAISKSLQIEPNAILNLSNPGAVAGLMGELTLPDTRRYSYVRDASLTSAQPAAATHNLNQTTTINVYGAAEPQVTANEIEARQTNIHSRLSQQLAGGPR